MRSLRLDGTDQTTRPDAGVDALEQKLAPAPKWPFALAACAALALAGAVTWPEAFDGSAQRLADNIGALQEVIQP